MPLVPFSNSTRGDKFVTVDRLGRLCLSVGLRRELDCLTSPIDLYVAYDKVNQRIGLAKTHVVRLVGMRPYRFDRLRGYAYARNFLKANQIPHGEPRRYNYIGREDPGWLTFQLAGYVAPDQPELPEI